MQQKILKPTGFRNSTIFNLVGRKTTEEVNKCLQLYSDGIFSPKVPKLLCFPRFVVTMQLEKSNAC